MAPKSYYALAEQTLRGLNEARDRLWEMLAKVPPLSSGEQEEIKIDLAEIKGEKDKVYQETLAVAQGTCTVTPPSDQDVNRARQLADQLDQMTLASNIASEVLAAATDILEIWGRTDPQPNPGS